MNLRSIVAYVDSASSEGEWFEALGATVQRESNTHIIASFGGVDIEVHSAAEETIEEFAVEAAVKPRFAGVYLYVRVPDARLLFSEIGDLSDDQGPVERPWGNVEFLVRSPSGLKIMFYSRP